MNWEMQHELVSIASYMQGQLPDEKPAYTLLDCFRPTGLRRTSICMMYIWFSCGIGYYGLFFATAPLVDNLAINVFINGLLELVPCLISLIVVPQYGRKQPMVIWSFLGGFSCILSCLVRGSEPSMDAGRTALIIIGRMALSGSFCCFLIWTAELYPTVLRGNGIGVCMFALRLGGVLAPQLLSLAFVTFQEFPIILMGIIALGGVVAAYPLAETMNMNLPDTVAEAENFGSKPVRDTRRQRRLPHHGSISTLDGGSVRMSQISQGTGT
ncbi:hypothetical protein RvY_15427-2 [Ramazzottius varieornatus]|uniref:Major facilitator superfamily (MFS) profile domain-containing protein n=1 Tax=Ramazzottius varieornatus TaxID=947166 RepID=A0A1D1VUW7_RAMVA|nr:hypothetical protein RvY_15427-2 [Ramazzottius varieornatus]